MNLQCATWRWELAAPIWKRLTRRGAEPWEAREKESLRSKHWQSIHSLLWMEGVFAGADPSMKSKSIPLGGKSLATFAVNKLHLRETDFVLMPISPLWWANLSILVKLTVVK